VEEAEAGVVVAVGEARDSGFRGTVMVEVGQACGDVVGIKTWCWPGRA
jgi:hypothetical protein